MKTALALLAALLVSATPVQAQQRVYNQAELDALLAPIALHPDGLLSQILMAATYPQDVADAAEWSRANPHVQGDAAVRAVEYEPWDPSVKALVAFPDVLARMAGSPQWLHDLGQAFLHQEPHVMDTVQGLRQRAQAGGYLSSNEQQAVYTSGDAIVVQPRTQYVYVPYYDPYVVYGPWWWPAYRPVYWAPCAFYPVFVTRGFFYSAPDWRHRHVRVVHRPVHVHPHQHSHVVPGKWQHRPSHHARPRADSRPNHDARPRHDSRPNHDTRPRHDARPRHDTGPRHDPRPKADVRAHVRTPEANRRPIVQHHQQMPAAHSFSQNVQRHAESVQRQIQQSHSRAAPEIRREVRAQPVPQARGHANGPARGHAYGQARGHSNSQRQSHSGRQPRG